MNWPRTRFSDLYLLPSRNGLNRPSRVRGEGYKMVNMGELFANDRIADIQMERVHMDERELEHFSLTRGDLLFARQSLVLEGAGKCSYIADVTEPTTFESHLIRVRMDRTKSDPMFYYYLFASPFSGMSTIVQQCAQAGIRSTDLADLAVLCPPLTIQRRIASILSAYDDLIDNNKRRIALLEQAARHIYEEWFVRLKFPGHERTRIVNGAPEGWSATKFGELCHEVRDAVSPEDIEPDTPYIGLEHMPRRSVSLFEWSRADTVTSTKHRYKGGDILFGKIRPYFHKVGLAFTDGIASSDAIVIRPTTDSVRELVLMTASSDSFVAYTAQAMREGSKMPRADWKVMTQYPCQLPPPAIYHPFAETISTITNQLCNLSAQNRKLRTARDLLLPRLMNVEFAA